LGLIDRRSLIAGAGASLIAAPALARALERPTRELMVPVPGGRVYVRVNGDLSARRAPIVMIHGGPGGTHAGFLEALPLADERAVILYDQLDTGRSDRPDDPANWRVSRFVDELEAIRSALASHAGTDWAPGGVERSSWNMAPAAPPRSSALPSQAR